LWKTHRLPRRAHLYRGPLTPDLHGQRPRSSHLGPSAPESQRLGQLVDGGPTAAGAIDDVAEPRRADLAGREPEDIAVADGGERSPDGSSQAGHLGAVEQAGRRRCSVTPEGVDEQVGRHDLAEMSDQRGDKESGELDLLLGEVAKDVRELGADSRWSRGWSRGS
jgi:hypothetical protein